MITDAILDFIFGAVEASMILLPSSNWQLPQSPAWTVLAGANLVLPIDYFLTLLGILISLATAMLAVWLVFKVISIIPGVF